MNRFLNVDMKKNGCAISFLVLTKHHKLGGLKQQNMFPARAEADQVPLPSLADGGPFSSPLSSHSLLSCTMHMVFFLTKPAIVGISV